MGVKIKRSDSIQCNRLPESHRMNVKIILRRVSESQFTHTSFAVEFSKRWELVSVPYSIRYLIYDCEVLAVP